VLPLEPTNLVGSIIMRPSGSVETQKRLFNAGLILRDGNTDLQPYLAAELPRLNTESWRVFPDGRMETRYRLKPDLVWHDGTRLVAEDFVFSWRVHTSPDIGVSGASPHTHMDEVLAEDERTVLIRWRRPFPEADALVGYAQQTAEHTIFGPLPTHLLERAFAEQRDTFLNHPFWTTGYVGLGPYRLDRWEPGAFVEAVGFERHVLGRPRIDRVRLTFSQDYNSTLANLLAGEADIPADNAIRAGEGVVLKREWTARAAGIVEFTPVQLRLLKAQLRPEFASPQAVRDGRVRKAMLHTIDRDVMNDALLDGLGVTTDSTIWPSERYYPEIDRVATKYPFEVRRSEQLMAEGGYRKGGDGLYTSTGEGLLTFELQSSRTTMYDAERSIIGHGWRQAGFATTERAFGPAEAQDNEGRSVFPAYTASSSGGGAAGFLVNYTTAAISRPETRWLGFNQGGWSNPDYDRFVEGLSTELDRARRDRLAVDAVRVLTEELPIIPLYFNPTVLAYPTALHGVVYRHPAAERTWNIHEWVFR
jgi:peptide/nickel transport system substrate-binding protein